ncbi:hypothetical protein FB451DRAFT_755041 [Mycena latifolia]|nr:hypothetical protein FB451DRAFT_755041 [Mycena latifolia]
MRVFVPRLGLSCDSRRLTVSFCAPPPASGWHIHFGGSTGATGAASSSHRLLLRGSSVVEASGSDREMDGLYQTVSAALRVEDLGVGGEEEGPEIGGGDGSDSAAGFKFGLPFCRKLFPLSAVCRPPKQHVSPHSACRLSLQSYQPYSKNSVPTQDGLTSERKSIPSRSNLVDRGARLSASDPRPILDWIRSSPAS